MNVNPNHSLRHTLQALQRDWKNGAHPIIDLKLSFWAYQPYNASVVHRNRHHAHSNYDGCQNVCCWHRHAKLILVPMSCLDCKQFGSGRHG